MSIYCKSCKNTFNPEPEVLITNGLCKYCFIEKLQGDLVNVTQTATLNERYARSFELKLAIAKAALEVIAKDEFDLPEDILTSESAYVARMALEQISPPVSLFSDDSDVWYCDWCNKEMHGDTGVSDANSHMHCSQECVDDHNANR